MLTTTLREYLKDFEVKKIRYCLDVISEGIQTYVAENPAVYKYRLSTPGRPQTVKYGNLLVRQDLPVFKQFDSCAIFWLSKKARLVIWPL